MVQQITWVCETARRVTNLSIPITMASVANDLRTWKSLDIHCGSNLKNTAGHRGREHHCPSTLTKRRCWLFSCSPGNVSISTNIEERYECASLALVCISKRCYYGRTGFELLSATANREYRAPAHVFCYSISLHTVSTASLDGAIESSRRSSQSLR